MAITDWTRKILWGRSGNRCAMCRCDLVLDSTPVDNESVVGDECHICSGKNHGPRYDPTFLTDRIDELDNLILLCRVHHKMVDDQSETYTADILRTLKANHQKWVSSTLTEQTATPRVRVRRIKENVPTHLMRLESGRAILAIVDSAYAFAFDHDELKLEAEVDLVGGFLQVAEDYGNLSGDLEAGDRVKAAFELSARLEELERSGFWVFGEREVRQIEGGVASPSPYPVAILKVLRASNPEIITMDQ
ncbi:HNH endonuclease [Candidatus Sumerlaeota bacterium]|nr:HNH endonuclease [Candidatus Sumerlaeota bacterium]